MCGWLPPVQRVGMVGTCGMPEIAEISNKYKSLKHLVCVASCGQCREHLVSVGLPSRRRPPPPRLNCPPFLFCLSLPHTALPSTIKPQSGARWLRHTGRSPPTPPPSSTQPAGHWRQGPGVTQFYAAPWSSGLERCHQVGRRRVLIRGSCLFLSSLSSLTCL